MCSALPAPEPARYPLAYTTYDHREIQAVIETLSAGQTTCGPRVRRFESAFADYVGRKHAIMVNSGSSADLLIAFGLGPAEPGDEVLVPAVTWPTQVSSCLMAGYRVRLVDVDPDTLQFSVADLAAKINDHTRAIFPVHVLGAVGDMDAIGRLAYMDGLMVLEDCCEALGARWNGYHVGTFGQAAAFSFFFSHLINTMEGGMVVTDSKESDRSYRLMRSHGWEPREDYRFWFPTWGFNVRPTELQGAFGNVQLGRLEGFRRARLGNYDRLVSGIANNGYLTRPRVLPQCEPSWHGYPLKVSLLAPYTRNDLCRHLNDHGIETRPIIAGNLAKQPAVQNDDRVITGPLPGADLVHEQGFYIGLASFDDPDGTAYVSQIITDFVGAF
jgi:CDP-6-deoxy-D-xylo-4-hexulose-3-dehydrase